MARQGIRVTKRRKGENEVLKEKRRETSRYKKRKRGKIFRKEQG